MTDALMIARPVRALSSAWDDAIAGGRDASERLYRAAGAPSIPEAERQCLRQLRHVRRRLRAALRRTTLPDGGYGESLLRRLDAVRRRRRPVNDLFPALYAQAIEDVIRASLRDYRAAALREMGRAS